MAVGQQAEQAASGAVDGHQGIAVARGANGVFHERAGGVIESLLNPLKFQQVANFYRSGHAPSVNRDDLFGKPGCLVR